MNEMRNEVEKARKLVLWAMVRSAKEMHPHEAEAFFRAEVEEMVKELSASHEAGMGCC